MEESVTFNNIADLRGPRNPAYSSLHTKRKNRVIAPGDANVTAFDGIDSDFLANWKLDDSWNSIPETVDNATEINYTHRYDIPVSNKVKLTTPQPENVQSPFNQSLTYSNKALACPEEEEAIVIDSDNLFEMVAKCDQVVKPTFELKAQNYNNKVLPASPDTEVPPPFLKDTNHVQVTDNLCSLDGLNIDMRKPNPGDGQYELIFEKLIKQMVNIKHVNEEENLPSETFKLGSVVYGTKEACMGMIEKAETFVGGTTGVLLKEDMPVSCGCYYVEEENYVVDSVLGKGSCGEVHACVDRRTKREFVRKQIKNNSFPRNEVYTLLNMKHSNISELFGFMKVERTYQIIMENCGDSLLYFAFQQETAQLLNEDLIQEFAQQGLQGLIYLKSKGIIHFDIKPENVCVKQTCGRWKLKITDFGAAKWPNMKHTFDGWTAEYMSPEACREFLRSRFPNIAISNEEGDFSVTTQTDLFAWGLTICFMIRKVHILLNFFTNGEVSYKNVSNPDQVKLQTILMMAKNPNLVSQLIPDCGFKLKRLLENILIGCPSRRISPEKALDDFTFIALESTWNTADSVTQSYDYSFIDYNTKVPSIAYLTACKGRRQRSDSLASQSSVMSVDYPSSPKSHVHTASKRVGPVKRKSVQKVLRHHCVNPYSDGKLQYAVQEEAVNGNVPNFNMIDE